MLNVQPVTLTGQHVRLEPLAERHAADLFEAAHDPDMWDYMSYGPFASRTDFDAYLQNAMKPSAAGREVAFATIHLVNHGLEIGHTWLDSRHWRTAVNTECKYMLLTHAFESLGAIRVQLKTDLRNVRSQNAIARLGAVHEGVLRNHMIVKNGYYRHTVMYSITDAEWPAVKAGLEAKLNGG
jgi:RimJ/RimL family protein N-acetyltransferase